MTDGDDDDEGEDENENDKIIMIVTKRLIMVISIIMTIISIIKKT